MRRISRTVWTMWLYQLSFGATTLFLGAPALAAIAVVAPAAWPSAMLAIVGLVMFLAISAWAAIEDGQIERFGDADSRLSLTDAAILFGLGSLYLSTLIGGGTAAAVAIETTAVPLPAAYVALFLPMLDMWLYRRVGVTPGSIPLLTALVLLHAVGVGRRVDSDRTRFFGQRPKPR